MFGSFFNYQQRILLELRIRALLIPQPHHFCLNSFFMLLYLLSLFSFLHIRLFFCPFFHPPFESSRFLPEVPGIQMCRVEVVLPAERPPQQQLESFFSSSSFNFRLMCFRFCLLCFRCQILQQQQQQQQLQLVLLCFGFGLLGFSLFLRQHLLLDGKLPNRLRICA